MSIKPLLALLGFVGWSVLCTQWYCCWMQVACESCGAEAYAEFNKPPVVPVAPIPSAAPVPFQWSATTLTDEADPAAFRKKILAGMKEDNVLELTGLYFEGEDKPAEITSLGLARAEELRRLLSDEVPADRILIKARQVAAPEGAKERGFYGIDFKWLDADKTTAATLEQFSDRVIIRFPYNSVQKDYEPEVDAYLVKLAERIVESKEKVSITGHTDDSGEEEYNNKLGMERAESIRKFLSDKGVSEEQMRVQSKGETQPVAANDTDENRHANRRVEVVVE